MASVFKANGAKKYTIVYTDESGRRRKAVGTTDKRVSERIAAKLEEDVALRKKGLIDPAAEKFAAYAREPIAEHLDAFEAALRNKGNTAKHIDHHVSRARRVVELAGIERLGRHR